MDDVDWALRGSDVTMGKNEKKPSPPGGGYYKKKWNGDKKKQHGPSKPTDVCPEKFQGGKEELDGNHFDCTGYGQQLDRFVKTVQKITD